LAWALLGRPFGAESVHPTERPVSSKKMWDMLSPEREGRSFTCNFGSESSASPRYHLTDYT